MQHLIGHEIGHVILFAALYLLYVRITHKNWTYKQLLLGLLISLSIDIDHLLDYLLSAGFVFNFNSILNGQYFAQSGRVVVFLHSYELAFYLIIFGYVREKSKQAKILLFPTLAGLSLASHLLWDIVYYGFNPIVYLIVYRALNQFSISIF